MSAFIKRYIKGSIMLVMTGIFYMALPINAVGFDCAKASTKVEKIICGNPELSKLDSELSGAYAHVFSSSENREEVKHNQKLWLKDVRNTCQDSECLRKVYVSRIRALIVNEWQEKVDLQEDNLPAPACTTKQAPDYCAWPQEKLMAHEQRIVDDAIKNIEKIILPNLKGAEWVPYDGFDPTTPKIEAYCTAKLTALREGRVKYFPQPQAKSSQIGFQMIMKREEAAIRRQRFKQSPDRITPFERKMADANTISRLDPQNFNPYASTSWFYELPSGFANLRLNPGGGKFTLGAVLGQRDVDQRFIGIALAESISSQTDPIKSGAGFFKEQAIGLVEIEGELFGIEGGVMIMDGDVRRWMNDIYLPIWDKTYDMSKDANHETWDARVLALYPLSPPWKEYYRQNNLPVGEKVLGEESDRAYDKPCMWNIQN